MKIEPFIKKIKDLINEKGEINQEPPNGVEAIVVREEHFSGKYSATIGIGLVNSSVSTTRYFDVRGKVYNDTLNKFSDSNLRIEPKVVATTKGLEYVCAVFKPGLIRAVDEAVWHNKFNNLNDLIDIIENLGKNDLKSLFESLK
ncbi:MAG: hypothetical protein DRO88_06925 [Promethearchaeia archaeon]|nr:MAG: hypothetical protein DRO88_06925 [Candidatus Lokiarchaeia archaeon]